MKFEVKNLTFGYDKKLLILNNLNFCCQSGEILAILGKNGVGKTTLLKNLTLSLNPLSGEILLDGKDIISEKPKELYNTLSYVPQQNYVYKEYSVFDAVLVGLSKFMSAFKMPGDVDTQKVDNILKEMNIYNLRDRHLYEISGGELQLVLISRALISNPKILILDEFETALDIKNQIYVLKLLRKLATEKKLIVLFNTHYIDHALNFSDKALLLSDNKYIFGESSEVLNSKNIHDTFNVNIEISKSNSGYKNISPII